MRRHPKLFTTLFALAAALSVLQGCSDATAASQRRRLELTGSSTVAPLVNEIRKRYEALHPNIRIDVQTGGSSRGIADAARGIADIGMASRGLKADETGELFAHTIAQDGVGMIVHASNPVRELTSAQVRGIYLGEINNWIEVGGEDAEIIVVNKAAGRATLEVFVKFFELDQKAIQADIVIGDNEQGIKSVSGGPHAIGYVSIGTAEFSAGTGVPIRLLPTAGIEASIESVGRGDFPISRPLNLITYGAPAGDALDFIEYCRSNEVHDLIEGLYFVPVRRIE